MGIEYLIVTIGIAYGFGIRGVILILVVLVAFFPVAMVLSVIARRLVPPTLEICDDEINDSCSARTEAPPKKWES
jgi:hypothetical protein